MSVTIRRSRSPKVLLKEWMNGVNLVIFFKGTFVVCRYILEARKRALAKKKKLRTLGRRARSQGSDDEEEEVDGTYTQYSCTVMGSWSTHTKEAILYCILS